MAELDTSKIAVCVSGISSKVVEHKKVIELQKQIKVALPNFNLGTSGPNKDGIDGIMGPRTKEGQRQMIQIKGQQSLQNLSNQGQKLVNSNILQVFSYRS